MKFKRVLLKISGEVVGGESASIDFEKVDEFAEELKEAIEAGAEIAVVMGGGNILRGYKASKWGVDRVTADCMGMLGTIINSMALQSALEQRGVEARVMTSISMEQFAEPYIRRRALNHMDKGRLVILAGGTGNPYFTTDTAAALRAVEIKADVLVKGTKVDGIYSGDPEIDLKAEKIDELSYNDVLKEELKIMDATSIALCRENSIPIIVFNLFKRGNLKKVLEGEKLGTIVQ
ncbi:MAG: UMP kinase [Candidatus Latescibacteria bacterium 4484_7]|nr:MAG: UMP kinase [Candidatus Latescibacteria bacterium 4484_7]RKZ05903.1 MAG: UMP kinase [bacterium]